MKTTCQICGKEFETIYPYQKYCSHDCYAVKQSKRERKYKRKPQIIIKCAYCGSDFLSNSKQRTFCSTKCRLNFYRVQKKKGREKRICAECGKWFTPTSNHQCCCSAQCSYARKLEYNCKPRPSIPQHLQFLKKQEQYTINEAIKQVEKPHCHDCGKPTNGTYRCPKCKDKFYKSLGYPQSDFSNYGDNDVD